jgi:hypothetical protein
VQARVALGLLTLLVAACGAPAKSAPSFAPLHLAPTTDLVQAANLIVLVDIEPRAILAHAELAGSLASAIPDERFRHFRAANENVDLRELEEITYAKYPEGELHLARGVFDPVAIERAFDARATVDGRAIDRHADALGTITRTWGSIGDRRSQLAVFGREVVGIEDGHFGPLRAAEFFAQEKLKRASPALRAEPFASASAFIGDAPFRIFASGPFEAPWNHAFGGLLGASTAVALSLKPARSDAAHDGDRIDVTLALFGSWGDDGPAAEARLAASVDLIRQSALGKLCGLDQAVAGPTKRITSNVIAIDATFQTEPFFRGIRDATTADAFEIFRSTLE